MMQNLIDSSNELQGRLDELYKAAQLQVTVQQTTQLTITASNKLLTV